MQTIELDCAPGMMRPGDLIEGVLEGVPVKLVEASRFFGNWTWVVDPADEAVYLQHQEKVKARITALYHQGAIRYGSW